MKKLLVVRHAKAVNDAGGDNDFGRILAEKGREDAQKLGAYLKQNYQAPTVALCSPAARTQETLSILCTETGWTPETIFSPKLYLASAGQILSELNELDDSITNAIIVGHNPGLHEFCLRLCDTTADELYATMLLTFPTCTFAAYVIPERSWKAVEPGEGELTDFRITSRAG